MKNNPVTLCPDLNLKWENEAFKLLGITFTLNLNQIVEVNYSSKIDEIKTLLSIWSKRILTPIGKSTIIKTLALPKLNHLIMGLPNPPEEMINYIQTLFYKFIWSNGPDKVKRNIILKVLKMVV